MTVLTCSLEGLPFREACEAFAKLLRRMASPEAFALEHAAVEEALQIDGFEVL